LGDLHIKGLKIINVNRKQELLDILSKSLSKFASLVLIELGMENDHSPHDLVADLLLQYHTELLKSKSVSINHLTQIYRKVNNCRRLPENFRELFKLRFSPDAEKKPEDEAQSKPSAKAPPPPAASAVSPSLTATSLNTPSITHNLNTTLAAASASAGIAGTSFINAAKKKKRIKIKVQLKAIKSTNNPKTLPNEEGGLAKGAKQNNQYGNPSSTTKNHSNRKGGEGGRQAAVAASKERNNETSNQPGDREWKYFQKNKNKTWKWSDPN
jgi:hypothetical protein